MFIIIFVWPILVRVKCSKISQTKSPTDENFSPTQLETTTALVCYFLPNVRHFLSKAYSDYNNFVHSSIKVHREKWQRLVMAPNEFNILRKIRKIRRKPITLEKFVLIRDRWIYIWKRIDSSNLRFLNVLVLFLFTFHLLLSNRFRLLNICNWFKLKWVILSAQCIQVFYISTYISIGLC